jgi:hypothetical protein
VLFLTATGIGFLAGMTRSIASIALAAILILAAFILATLAGPTSLLSLVVAVLGFNFGLMALIAATAAVLSLRHAFGSQSGMTR